MLGDVGSLVFGSIFAFVSLFHFVIYYRRRDRREYLWFSLFSLGFSANTFGVSLWPEAAGLPEVIARRLAPVSGNFIAFFAVQFLWPFIGLSIPRWLRAYQGSHLLIMLLVAIAPWTWVQATETARWLWLIPLLAAAGHALLLQSYRASREARTVLIGGLIMIAAESVLIAFQTSMPIATGGLAEWAFMILVLSMAVALAQQISDSLEQFRGSHDLLEQEVRKRTSQLEQAKEEAVRANQAKGAFLAMMSHELRTPMTGVKAAADLLEQTALQPDQSEALGFLTQSARAQIRLTR